jgi:hypothetical protein
MAAAMPPSAITVWALPSRDLHTTAVLAPASCAAMAARRPAPPAPITTTSYRCCSMPWMPRASTGDIRFPVIGCRSSIGVSVIKTLFGVPAEL